MIAQLRGARIQHVRDDARARRGVRHADPIGAARDLSLSRGAALRVGPASKIGSPNEPELLPATVGELKRLAIRPREAAFDGGFSAGQANAALPDTAVFVAGRQQPASRRSRKRLACYRVGAEGRISHLKRSYGLRRSRLRGHDGARTWVGWRLLAYNLDTLAARAVQTA